MNLNYPKFSFQFLVIAFIILGGCSSDNKRKTEEKLNPAITQPTPTKPDTVSGNIDYSEANKILLKYQEFLTPYKFEDFPANDKFLGKPAALDVTSPIEAALYRKTFSKALQAGSNFAGHFTLVSINCGANCQENYIIDTRTGKVCDKVRSILGASYKPDSKLLILNAPNPMNIEIYQKLPECKPEVYLEKNNLLYKAKLVKQ